MSASHSFLEKNRNALLKSEIDPNTVPPDYAGRTLLHYAVFNRDTTLAKLLLEQWHVDPNAQDEEGDTPLHYCSVYKDNACVDILLENGANPNMQNCTLLTPFHYAAANAFRVKKFLECGADPNIQDEDGKTPFHHATECDNVEVLDLFLDNGANLYIEDNKGQTPYDVTPVMSRSRNFLDRYQYLP